MLNCCSETVTRNCFSRYHEAQKVMMESNIATSRETTRLILVVSPKLFIHSTPRSDMPCPT